MESKQVIDGRNRKREPRMGSKEGTGGRGTWNLMKELKE
jgi:hypothetical protein